MREKRREWRNDGPRLRSPVAQARALLGGETDTIANASNFSAFIFHEISA